MRPFNTFGPRQSERAVLPTIISQCLAGQSIKLGNLRPTRDLTFVTDTVEGFLLAAAAPDVVGMTINLGSGREISIEDLVHLIAGLVGRPITVESDEDRIRPDASEVMRLLSDNRLARTALGWAPSVTLESGLLRTIEWVRGNPQSYRTGVYAV